MAHPRFEDSFSFSSYDRDKALQTWLSQWREGRKISLEYLDEAIENSAEVVGFPDFWRTRSSSDFSEWGPAAYQIGFESNHGKEVFVFDLAGMSLEKTADRFLLWSAPGDEAVIVYVAPSYTKNFMQDLRQQRGNIPVHFLYTPENSTGFEIFTDDMGAPDQPEDKGLEKLLMAQKRPVRPQNLRDSRELVEGYVAEALEKDMSPPEARVEATRVCAWLEFFAKEAGRIEGMKTRSYEDEEK
jgi:hypothetical protein